jgi:hypothetical protein
LQTLQHEIAHAIGFNSETIARKNLVTTKTIPEGHYGFLGKKALEEYHKLGGKPEHKSVPLEDEPNPGAPHWNEWLFPDSREENRYFGVIGVDELMTTANPPGKDAILSKLTLAAFEDLGIDVDYTKAGNINVFSGSYIPPLSNPLFGIDYLN